MRISLLVPAWNEAKSIRKSALSWLEQTRPFDEIIVVNDCSTDNTAEILAEFADKITVVTPEKRCGNKSYAQEYGMNFVTGDVFVATDGDTILDKDFVKFIEEDFTDDNVTAVAGYIRSIKYNWLTACRAFEYAVGQNLHKLAQGYINFLFVIPGAAGAFRTKKFLDYLKFEHDTVTEDLSFTYDLHRQGFQILYDRRAVVFTQDPSNIHSYINQMRRWFSGGWQCLIKHGSLAFKEPKVALELSLMYLEGIVFSALFFVAPILSLRFFSNFIIAYLVIAFAFALFAAIRERRWGLLFIPIPYLFLVAINAYVFLETGFKEIVLRKRQLHWFSPKRVEM